MEIAALELRIEELDLDRVALKKDGVEAMYLESEYEDVEDRIQCLFAYASTLPAKCTEGAILQIALADTIYHLATSDSDPPSWRVKQDDKRFSRLIWSAVRALSDDPDFDLPAMGVHGRFLGEHHNPWNTYERNVNIVREGCELVERAHG